MVGHTILRLYSPGPFRLPLLSSQGGEHVRNAGRASVFVSAGKHHALGLFTPDRCSAPSGQLDRRTCQLRGLVHEIVATGNEVLRLFTDEGVVPVGASVPG